MESQERAAFIAPSRRRRRLIVTGLALLAVSLAALMFVSLSVFGVWGASPSPPPTQVAGRAAGAIAAKHLPPQANLQGGADSHVLSRLAASGQVSISSARPTLSPDEAVIGGRPAFGASPPFPPVFLGQEYLAAEALRPTINVYSTFPPTGKPELVMDRTGRFGTPNAFLVLQQAVDLRGGLWYQVYLPRRPNMSKGWLNAKDVATSRIIYDIRIDLSRHRMELWELGRPVRSYPVGVGKRMWPTPTGDFFVAAVLHPSNPYGAYGPRQLGLSAFSDVLTDWPGGGQVAIHGTNRPAAVGTDVSHGCVRMLNEDILDLASFASVGTPVYIRR